MHSSTKQKLRLLKQRFIKPQVEELRFPTSLSPMSTIDYTISLDSSPTPTSSSIRSPSIASGDSAADKGLMDLIYKDKGPKIKPYIYSQVQQQSQSLASKFNKNIGSHKCFICEELIQSTLINESILELECGDYIHEQCFQISVDYKIDGLLKASTFTVNKSKLSDMILPVCQGTNCRNMDLKISLIDSDYLNDTLTNAIAKSIEYDKLHLHSDSSSDSSSSISAFSQQTTPPSQSPSVFPTPKSQRNSVSRQNSTRISRRISTSNPLNLNAQANYNINGLKSPIDLPFRITRGESMVSFPSASSMRSPSPNPSVTTMTEFIKIKDHDAIPLESLKDQLLQKLTTCTPLKLNTLIKLGNLRLADKLLVRYEETGPWETRIIYLFKNFLVILDPSHELQLIDLNIFSFFIEGLAVKIFDFGSQKNVWLNAEVPSIVEKWVVGLSDFEFTFPSEFLTSTIRLDKPLFSKSRMSDSTINIIKEVPSNPSSSGTLSRAGDRGSASNTSSMYYDSDEEMINDIMRTLDIPDLPPPTIERSSLDHSIFDCPSLDHSIEQPSSAGTTKHKDIKMEINETFSPVVTTFDSKDFSLGALGAEDSDSSDEYDSDEFRIQSLLKNNSGALVAPT